MRFQDMTVIVTGGARGMGAEHCRGFVGEGARVVVADVLDDDGRSLAADLGDRATYAHLDVTDESAWSALVEQVERDLGPIAVLVNNAGIGGVPTPLEETTLADWHRVLSVAAMELAVDGIRVNSVHPGYISTPLLAGVEDTALRGRVAIERLGNPADVTPAVLFAASSEARYITGAEIPVDGGWAAGEPTPIFVPPGTRLPEGVRG